MEDEDGETIFVWVGGEDEPELIEQPPTLH
jgi:hypothetical protein